MLTTGLEPIALLSSLLINVDPPKWQKKTYPT